METETPLASIILDNIFSIYEEVMQKIKSKDKVDEKKEDKESCLIDDKRKPEVISGDEKNAFLPRFIITPAQGTSSGLRKKE